MSLLTNISANKWLASAVSYLQSALQGVLFIMILVFLGLAWWRYQKTIFMISQNRTGSTQSLSIDENTSQSQLPPLSYYMGLVESRNLFRMNVADSQKTAEISDPVSSFGQEFINRFIVQGIVFDNNPMAIIKDLQSQKTYFIHRSEKLDQAILVEFRENRVVFNRGGEMVELIKK